MSSPRRRRNGERRRTGKKGATAPIKKRLGRIDFLRWVPAAAALIFLTLAITRFDPKLSIIGDNAQFLILGRSIASGQGYSQINAPEPLPHTKYPPFFPLILAAVQIAFPWSYVAPKIVVLILATAAIYLLGLLLVKRFPAEIAVPALALTAIHPELVQFSYTILSEIPYLFLTAAAFLLFSRWEREGGRKTLAVAFAFAIASYYTRTIGITLIFAFIGSVLLRRRFRTALLLLVTALVLALPWTIRNRSVSTGESYLHQLMCVYPYEPARGTLTLKQFFTLRIANNIRNYGATEIGGGVCSNVELNQSALPKNVWKGLSIASSILIVIGLAGRMIRRKEVFEIYTILYLAVCLVWPDVWASLRFLLPILPFLFIYVLTALRDGALLLRRFGVPRWSHIVVALILAFPALRANRLYAVEGNEYGTNWVNYFKAARWVKENTDESAIVACRKPYLFYLVSRRRTDPYLWSYDEDKVFQQMVDHGVEYVVVSQLSGTERKYLVPSVNKHSDRFRVLRRFTDPDTIVLRLLPEGSP